MALSALEYSFLFFATLYFVSIRQWRQNKKNITLPPGPPRKPIVGNLFDIPQHKSWLKFSEWHKQHGDLVYVEALGNKILVLNTMKAVNDLLVDRANIYSDRPTFTMVGELMGLENSLALSPYGPTLRQHRKLCHVAFSPEAVKKYHGIQEEAITMYLKEIIEMPQNFVKQLRLTAGRIIMSVTYGIPASTPDDVYIVEAEETMEMIGKSTVPGAHLVDLLPILRLLPSWFPYNSIPRVAKYGRDLIWSMISRPYEAVKVDRSTGTALPSFVADCLDLFESGDMALSTEDADHLIRWAAGAMYGAGAETTYATILSFMIAMVKFPDVQKKLQEEIDRVIGSDRLPTVQDRPNLPYVNAAIKEALRWRPALPFSIARKLKEDDVYNGYLIPKGTIVMPNVWTISVDNESGIPPEQFAPERFLEQNAGKTAQDPTSYAFGFGRRICPGRHLGETNLFLLISGLSATVDIGGPVDMKNDPRLFDAEYTSGLVSHPKPYELKITPRSQEIATFVKERAEAV
ncbi:cytochrome P450 [Dendrothele bispora CBS 962.96]|uniref:Cytochrome P450 n=1 Tax=Dendrothele bispora (strain CBS 962.96) TaxID=1314807 RepID=A0A4S8M2U5_DENBC|nr:cytochrome P450 [Dendrothele bispora CBS 962.96]